MSSASSRAPSPDRLSYRSPRPSHGITIDDSGGTSPQTAGTAIPQSSASLETASPTQVEVGGVPDLANVPYRWTLPNGEVKMYTLQKLMGVMNVLVNRVDALERKNAGTDFETAAKTQQRLLWLEGRMGQPHSSRDEAIFDTLERFERNLLRLHKDVHEGGSPPLPHLPTPAPPYPTSLPGQGGGGPGTLPLREALGHLLYPTVMMSKEESSSAFDWGNKGKQPDDDVEEDLYKIYMNRLEKHDEAARQHVRALAKARETNEMMQEKLEEAMEKADRTMAENKEFKERVNELAAALHKDRKSVV